VPTAKIGALLTGKLNWDGLLELAGHHGVQGIVANRLQEIAFAGVPASARASLQNRTRTQQLFTLSLTAELFRILQDFSEARVQAVLNKGPLVSLLAYGDSAVRSYGDLDLLVRHRDIRAAAQRMVELGFHSEIPQSAIDAGKIPGEYVFRKPGTALLVELHTERTFRYYPKGMPIDDLFARKRTVLLEGKEVPVLSLEDEFLFNCVHGAKDFWARLLWVSDIAGMVARHPEMRWAEVKSNSALTGAGRMLRVAVHLASLVLGVTIPTALAGEIRKDRATEALCRRIQGWLPYAGVVPPTLARRAKFRVDMAGGGLAGAAFLARLSLSPTQEDWTEGAEERRSWLWDAVRRPLRLFRKYGSSE
jgi:hypothetical protein